MNLKKSNRLDKTQSQLKEKRKIIQENHHQVKGYQKQYLKSLQRKLTKSVTQKIPPSSNRKFCYYKNALNGLNTGLEKVRIVVTYFRTCALPSEKVKFWASKPHNIIKDNKARISCENHGQSMRHKQNNTIVKLLKSGRSKGKGLFKTK